MTLAERLSSGTLVLDGAMGTALMARGASGSNERWGVDHPEVLLDIHRGYLGAGADAVITDTFGGTRLKLERAGLADETVRLNRTLAEIARRAVDQAGRQAFVLGDIGPTGQLPEPYGDMTEDELRDAFAEQVEALASGGVDGFIVETMMDPVEAACAVSAAVRVAPSLPVLASLTFDRKPVGFRTMMGARPGDGARRLADAGATVIGANCGGLRPEDFVPLLAEMREAVRLPLVVEANAGLPRIVDGEAVFDEPPATFGSLVDAFVNEGAVAIGGCCGTTLDHIRAISDALDARTP